MKTAPSKEIIAFWLLNTAIEFPRRISAILPAVDAESLNVKPVPGCASKDYADGIADLFAAEMIRIHSNLPEDDLQGREGVARILEMVSRSGRPSIVRPIQQETVRRVFYFELTAKGGAAWERMAEPDWSNFYSESSDCRTGDAVSPNLTLLMARMGWFPELSGQRIHLDTIEFEEHLDYQVLYWKRLARVYRASFCCEPANERWGGQGGSGIDEPEWFTQWRHSASSWYTKPWELAGWPRDSAGAKRPRPR